MAASVTASVAIGNSAAPSTTLETASFTPTGANKAIYVLVGSGAASPNSPTAVKYASASGVGGESLSLLDSVRLIAPSNNIRTSVWKLANPSAASGTIHVTYGGSDDERWIVARAVQDADGTEGAIAFATGNNTAPSVTVTTTSGNLVLDFMSMLDGAGPSGGVTVTQGGSQTLDKKLDTDTPTGGSATNISAFESAGTSHQTASGTSTVMSWTLSRTSEWGIHSFQVNPAAAAPSVGSRIRRNTIHPGRHPDRFGKRLRTRRNNTVSALSPITGTAAVTDGGATASASGLTTISGTGSARSGSDSASASGSVQAPIPSRIARRTLHPGIRGPYNPIRFRKTINTAPAALLPLTGSAAVISAGDSVSASGTPRVTGSGAVQSASDAAAATGAPIVAGSAAVQSRPDSSAASGSPIVSGTAAVQDKSDSASASQNSAPVTGTAAVLSGNDSAAASGSPVIAGSGSAFAQGDRAAATVSLLVTGFGSVISGGAASAATASLQVTGSAAAASRGDSPSATGTLQITGTGAARAGNDATFFPPNTGTVFSNYEEFLEDD